MGAGLNQAALGALLGVRQTVVSRWELGKLEPGLAELLLIAQATATPIDDLVLPTARSRQRHRHPGDRVVGSRLGRHVRAERETRGWDCVSFGRRAGIVPRRLRQLEEGAPPSTAELLRLAGALGQKPSELLIAAGLDTSRDAHRVR